MSIKTVFLSSTARDLAEYREAVTDAINGLDDYKCVRMEDFGARDWAADDFCQTKVAGCDLFVGIVGYLYGSCPPGSEQSYTEREYEAAVAAGMPRLMFIAPEEFPLPAHLIEPDEKRHKQRAFRERVSRERIRDTFTSPENLARRVVQAIRNWEQTAIQQRPLTAIERLPDQPAPSPRHAQSVVAVDISHQQDEWEGYYGSLHKIAEGLPEFSFQPIGPHQGISRQLLRDYAALILALPWHCTFSSDEPRGEINEIKRWVWDDGGRLLLLGYYLADTHHECNINSLARGFRFEFSEDLIMPLGRSSHDDCDRQAFNLGDKDFWVSVELQGPATHRITEGVGKVAFLSSCSLTNIAAHPELVVNSPSSAVMRAVGHKDANGWMIKVEDWIPDREASVPLLAAWRCGLGKVVAAGTWKLFLPAFADESAPFDNAHLFRNIISWLAS